MTVIAFDYCQGVILIQCNYGGFEDSECDAGGGFFLKVGGLVRNLRQSVAVFMFDFGYLYVDQWW